MNRWLTPVLTALITCSLVVPAHAHSRLSTIFKKKYRLRSVSCKACHVKEEEKYLFNAFGERMGKLLEGKKLTARLDAAKEASSEEKDAIHEQVEKDFLEALEKLDAMKAPSGKTYAEAIPLGEIKDTKPRK